MLNSQCCSIADEAGAPPDYPTMAARCSLYLDSLPALESADLQAALKNYLPAFDPDERAEALSTWLSTIRDYQYFAARNNWT